MAKSELEQRWKSLPQQVKIDLWALADIRDMSLDKPVSWIQTRTHVLRKGSSKGYQSQFYNEQTKCTFTEAERVRLRDFSMFALWNGLRLAGEEKAANYILGRQPQPVDWIRLTEIDALIEDLDLTIAQFEDLFAIREI